MAYDRYDARGPSRERSRMDDRWRERDSDFGRRDDYGRRDERGFFERAGDEIASWFGDDEAERRRRMDEARGRDWDRGNRDWDRGRFEGRSNINRWDRDDDDRSFLSGRGYRGTTGESGQRQSAWGGTDRSDYGEFGDRSHGRERGYRPMTGDYGRSEQDRDYGRGDFGRREYGRSHFDRDDIRSTSYAGSAARGGMHDPHYSEWRRRQVDELDRDYDDYRRENQSRFEEDFGNWRQTRQSKRQMLGQVREHMEVVGSDGEHVGTVDKARGDRIILTKSDEDADGRHHSIPCTMLDRIEENKVILDCEAEKAKEKWRDDDRERALFERDDQGEAGPMMLDRSFSGTYR